MTFGERLITVHLMANQGLLQGSASLKEAKDKHRLLDMVFLDKTTICAHHKAAGAAKQGV
ncbi:hypothetical protein GLUCORHAEAF1_12190 [Komagataeibacter rhaeticus AF1]|uniref:hypothetical protein n=1 Tax=Komagataeibacter rhaeticus TaxID=215221 RepID=UPI0004D7125F|nr:hypothetical protein [Komagataeibacter rhaeticus]KDU94738.1 hypothetical protein GLUCORHAEAF1_12190 [Komagataeibacter rhaeticus AF1]